MPKLLTFVIVLSAISLTGCTNSTVPVIAIETASERELCRQWGASLPTRSRSDTIQTRAEIQEAYHFRWPAQTGRI